MSMFSKLDKEIIIISIVSVVVIALIGFVLYQYIFSAGVKIENLAGGATTEENK